MTALRLVSSHDLPIAGLPEGRTTAQALAKAVEMREMLWAARLPEDEKLKQLEAFCRRLYGDDVVSGQLLASAALYG